jgi:hypothetical protein
MMLPPFAAYELPYPKSCHVFLSGTQSIPSATWTVVGINSVLWDTYGLYTGGANNYITIPEDGLFLIIGRIQSLDTITSYLGCSIYLNGSLYVYKYEAPNPTNRTIVFITCMMMINKNDTIDLRVLYGGTTNINIGQYSKETFLQVLKLPYITKGY